MIKLYISGRATLYNIKPHQYAFRRQRPSVRPSFQTQSPCGGLGLPYRAEALERTAVHQWGKWKWSWWVISPFNAIYVYVYHITSHRHHQDHVTNVWLMDLDGHSQWPFSNFVGNVGISVHFQETTAQLSDWNDCSSGQQDRHYWLYAWWFGTFLEIFHSVGNFIIPTDFHIFQRGTLW